MERLPDAQVKISFQTGLFRVEFVWELDLKRLRVDLDDRTLTPLVARRTKRRTHLCQRPLDNGQPLAAKAPTRGRAAARAEVVTASTALADVKGCGAGSNLAQSTKRDVGSAIGITVVRPRDDQQTWLVRTLVRWSRAWISSERIRVCAPVYSTTRRIAGSG